MKKLTPLYQKLVEFNLAEKIRNCLTDLGKLRNGFDHAWAGRAKPEEDIKQKAFQLFEILKNIFEELKTKAKIFG